MLAKILILAAFFAVTIAVGVVFRRHSLSVGGFVLGGRSVGPWLTAFAYGTSYFSAVVFVGYAGQFGWDFGISATWIGIGNALIGSLLAWVVLGRRTRIMTKHLESATMPDFFSKRFGSPALKTASSLLIFVFLIPYSASVYKGLSELFSMAFGIDYVWCIAGMAALTAAYVVLGGYMATAVNDLIQGVIMLVGIVLVVASVLNGQGGFTEAVTRLSQKTCETAPAMQGAYTSFFGPDPAALLSVVLLTSLGTWGLPQMIHKFYSIRDEKSIKTGTVISTIFAAVVAGGSYFMGGFGRLYYAPDGAVATDQIIPQMLETALPDLLIGVVVVLALSASMSTLSSLVITSSSTFTLDFLRTFMGKRLNEKKQMVLIRVLCVGFVLVSVLIALNPSALITSLMGLSWGALAGAFLGPFLFGLFWKRTTAASVWASFGTSLLIAVGNSVFHVTTATIAGAAAMLVSLAVVPLVSLLTPKPDAARVDGIFACYDVPVVVHNATALPDRSEQPEEM